MVALWEIYQSTLIEEEKQAYHRGDGVVDRDGVSATLLGDGADQLRRSYTTRYALEAFLHRQ